MRNTQLEVDAAKLLIETKKNDGFQEVGEIKIVN